MEFVNGPLFLSQTFALNQKKPLTYFFRSDCAFVLNSPLSIFLHNEVVCQKCLKSHFILCQAQSSKKFFSIYA